MNILKNLRSTPVSLAILAAAIFGNAALAAEPTQYPLLSKAGGVPPPNIMMTLDTSWSMNWGNMPEGTFTVNSKSVTLPAISVIFHPQDPFYEPGTIWSTDNNENDNGVVISDPSTSISDAQQLYQAQMRSSDVNRIYYNPALTYKPWLTAEKDANGNYIAMPDAPPAAAPFHPLRDATTDPTLAVTPAPPAPPHALTANLTASSTYNIRKWCRATGAGNCLTSSNVSRTFDPAVYYVLSPSTADPTVLNNYKRYNINAMTVRTGSGTPAAITDFPKGAKRTDCGDDTVKVCTKAQELQNFANWFTYYRTRLLLAQASIPDAFIKMDGSKIRLGWGSIHQQSLNANSVDGVNSTIVQQGVRPLTEDLKKSMVSWMRNANNRFSMATSGDARYTATGTLRLWGGTPLRVATAGVGEYFTRADARNPWAGNPANGDGSDTADLTCRRSYNILVTDGYWNESYSGTGNYDGGTMPDYKAINDRSKDKPITFPTISSDLSSETFTYSPKAPFKDTNIDMVADVALYYWARDLRPNLKNRVNASAENPAFWQHVSMFTVGLGVKGTLDYTSATVLQNLIDGKTTWGADKIDDLWHAAINSRGQYFSAQDSTELSDAMSSALGRAAADEGQPQGGVATASASLTSGNKKFIPSYRPVQWTGDLKAFSLDENGVAGTTALWTASENLPVPASRKIYTWTGSKSIPFNGSDLETAGISGELGKGYSQDMVNYLRGVTGNAAYRVRDGKLPDFINSSPTYVRDAIDLGYTGLEDAQGGTKYSKYLADIKGKRAGVVAIGGNGGMLHIFNDVATTTTKAGEEIFAYVPKTVLPNMWKLTDKKYGSDALYHQYFVDGDLVEHDYYNGTDWKSILVGSLGAGGRAIFSLDVTSTTPSSFGANTVRWEHTDNDVGYITSDAEVGIEPGATVHKVFVGNGYGSVNGHAALLILDAATGLPIADTPIIAAKGPGNGLGGVRLVRNAKQQVIAAYAGDLLGNMYRFEYNTTTKKWTVGFGGKPLATAVSKGGKAQPITAAPAYIPSGTGNVVLFGTGRLYDEDDQKDSTSVQTAYGVIDPTAEGVSTATAASPAPTRTNMTEQTISATTLTEKGGTYYTVSANAPITDAKGWYMDYTITGGQRTLYPTIVLGDFVYISTVAPATTAAYCESSSGRGFNFLLNARTGQQVEKVILDTDGDGIVETTNGEDKAAAGFETPADGGDTPLTQLMGGSKQIRASFQNTKGKQNADLYCLYGCTKKVDRVWRQLLTPPHP
jgi:type IV pilus assembly protein PilY1